MKPHQVYVSPVNINSNTHTGKRAPVVTAIGSDGVFIHAMEAEFKGPSTLVYRPESPMASGARVWVETFGEVVFTMNDGTKRTLPAANADGP